MKKLYIPFPSMIAGQLSNRLKFSENIQAGYSQEKKDAGKYRGFKSADLLYAPAKDRNSGNYVKTSKLAELLAADDQLYVNAHCNRGLDTLSLNAECSSAQKVTVDDLVLQLQAHGLKQESRARIKLWACHAALGDGNKESFAALFSKAMFLAEYTQCRIFAYTESLLAQYETREDIEGEEPVAHKRANVVKSAEERLHEMAEVFGGAVVPSDLAGKKRSWDVMLKAKNGDKEALIREIVESAMKTDLFLGKPKDLATPGARASKFRKEFRNGVVVDP